MKTLYSLLPMILPLFLFGSEKEFLDYNFDGTLDYRIWRESNGRLAYYDVYLFSKEKNVFEKHLGLSQLYNPIPNEKSKEIECIWPAGHSGMIYTKEIYVWDGEKVKLSRTQKQENVRIGKKWEYIRVSASIFEGKPRVEKIEHIKTLP
jgi:hypothetical protein